MTTKVQQTSHHPFKSLSDSDLNSSSSTSNVENVDKKRVTVNNDVDKDKKRVTINDVSFDSSTADSSIDQLKSKTLPSKGKQSLTLKRTNSLKRSITLPR